MRKPRITRRQRLFSLFLICSFFGLLLTVMAFSVVIYVLGRAGRLGESELSTLQGSLPLMLGAMLTMALGTVLAGLLVRIPLKSINTLMDGLNSLASGHFEQRVELGESRMMRELSDSFNTLAQELQNTEMLRSDFINNFSHEFKTPIVSIRGFARILQRGGLTEEQQQEYLSIIVDESTRLSSMATNVLSLSKVENQSILTDVSSYNLSEQLRKCILVLESKWTAKGLSVEADFGEYHVRGNEEQLKQVWLNLVDNAVKFSPEGGEIRVDVCRQGAWLCVTVVNHGPAMTEEERRRAFDKFWQGDTSHAAEGTGIGLSVVKKIVELHRGSVDVDSSEEGTVFTVRLPAV